MKITALKFIIVLMVFLSFLVVSSFYYQISAQNLTNEIIGWLWSENYGWVSLSSDNCQRMVQINQSSGCIYADGQLVDYGVYLENNQLYGWGWSENVGWVCFGSTCSNLSSEFGLQIPLSGWNISLANGQLTGWAKVLSLGDDGWVKFDGQTSVKPNNRPLGNACYNCQDVCVSYSACSEGDVDCQPQCIEFEKRCDSCFSQTKFGGVNNNNPYHPEVSEIGENCNDNPQDCWLEGGNAYFCSSCRPCQEDGLPNGGYRVFCQDCNQCRNFGSVADVVYESGDGQLYGWLWNGNENKVDGAGWLRFFSGSLIVNPWLETRYGDIYTSNAIRQRSAEIGKSATYCIFAQDVYHISSAKCQEIIKGIKFQFPESVNDVYRNVLGKIDFFGITTRVSGDYNKYGNKIVDISDGWSGPVDGIMNNNIYHAKGDLTLGVLGFNNAAVGGKGNGIIMVEGDLYLNGDINYIGSGIPSDLSQTASIAWIVKGDIIVDSRVENLVGAFIALGNGNSCQNLSGGLYDSYQSNSCGVFYSGDSDRNLTVLGIILARAFDFKRYYSDSLKGSELIIYDGRLVANPPPGMQGFFESLPVIKE